MTRTLLVVAEAILPRWLFARLLWRCTRQGLARWRREAHPNQPDRHDGCTAPAMWP